MAQKIVGSNPWADKLLTGVLLTQIYSEGRRKKDWFRETPNQLIMQVSPSN